MALGPGETRKVISHQFSVVSKTVDWELTTGDWQLIPKPLALTPRQAAAFKCEVALAATVVSPRA